MAQRPLFFFLLLFLLAAAISPASAVEEVRQDHIKSFNLQAPETLGFSGVELYNLEPNSNTSIFLDNYGEIYTLQVNSTKNYYSWWNFDVSLTNPNGTVEHKNLKSLAPFALNYDLHIQYYWQGLNNTIDTSYFDIDLYTGFLPLQAILNDYNPTASQPLQFSQITASSNSYFDLLCYAVTAEEFEKQDNNDPLAPITELTEDFFSWTWNTVLIFVGQIPYVGDDLVTAILIASYIIEEIFFYFNLLFIEYREATVLTFEFFLITYSLHRTRTKSPVILCKNVIADHKAVYEKIFAAIKFAIDLLTSIISTIAHVIQGLKPT